MGLCCYTAAHHTLSKETRLELSGCCAPLYRLRQGFDRLEITDPRWKLSARWLTALALILSAAVLMASIRVMPLEMAQGNLLKSEARLRLNADPFPGVP